MAKKFKDGQYDKTNQTKFLYRSSNYVTEDGIKGTETEVYKKVYGRKHFWRVWLGDFLYALGLINNSKQLDIVFYVMEETDPGSNLFIGTIQGVVKDTKISYGTVATIFKKMQDADLMKKVQNGVYQVNPSLIMKGSDHKQDRLVIEYHNLGEKSDETVETATVQQLPGQISLLESVSKNEQGTNRPSQKDQPSRISAVGG